MLYRSTDRRCRRGAPMVNLSHSASFHSREKTAPSNSGIKHLAEAEALITETLVEEENTDVLLSELAEDAINPAAAAAA